MNFLMQFNSWLVLIVVALIFYCLTIHARYKRGASRLWLAMIAVSMLLGLAANLSPWYHRPEILLTLRETGFYVFVFVLLIAQLRGKEIL